MRIEDINIDDIYAYDTINGIFFDNTKVVNDNYNIGDVLRYDSRFTIIKTFSDYIISDLLINTNKIYNIIVYQDTHLILNKNGTLSKAMDVKLSFTNNISHRLNISSDSIYNIESVIRSRKLDELLNIIDE